MGITFQRDAYQVIEKDIPWVLKLQRGQAKIYISKWAEIELIIEGFLNQMI